MDGVSLLKQQHKEVKQLFKEYEGKSDGAKQQRKQIVDEVLQKLTLHSKLEEEIFYPAVREKATKDLKATIAEGYEEHAIVDRLVEELKGLEPDDERYYAKFTVLMEEVRHHIDEEEKEMLPDAEKRLGSENETLGFKMEEKQQQLMAGAMR
ncbi:MAG TPA: hemerythrin domain-containing protein [Dehalococcoidia bacterium]|nr:hemerythrin domain-containing protein [Dehalococcoidia bacterium]